MFWEEYHNLMAIRFFNETSEKSFSKKHNKVLQRFFIKNEKDIKIGRWMYLNCVFYP